MPLLSLDSMSFPAMLVHHAAVADLLALPIVANLDHLLTNGNLVTDLNTERWGAVSHQVLVSSLVSVVLWDVVKVLSSNDNGTCHLGRDDPAGEDTSTDGDGTGPGALLVNVLSVDGGRGSLESQTDILVPPPVSGGLADGLGVVEDGLLLESTPVRGRGRR